MSCCGDRRLKKEAEISSSSCDELESDIVYVGSYNTNKAVKKCSSPSNLFPEIVLSDTENETVFINEQKLFSFKIASENMNLRGNLKRKGFRHFSDRGTASKRKRRKIPWNDCESDAYCESNCAHNAQENKTAHESPFSNTRNKSLENENNASENSNFKRNETMEESAALNITNNHFKFKTNRSANEKNVAENSTFSDTCSNCGAYVSQGNETMQESPVSNIRNDSLETNRYGLFTHKSNMNHKKQKYSLNNFRSTQNKKNMLCKTISQPDERDAFGQNTDFTSATATEMQTNNDNVFKSSTFHRENFPDDINEYDFDEKDNVRNFSDIKIHKRHVQDDNLKELMINVNSLENVHESISGCETVRKKHVSFILPSSQKLLLSSEICNDYQESCRNHLQNTDGESIYKSMKDSKYISFMNPYKSSICSECQRNFAILQTIHASMQRRVRKRINNTGETRPTRKLRRRRRRKRNTSSRAGETAIGDKIKKEKIYIKRETKEKNGSVKTGLNFFKREVKKEKP